jgi:hypothetical protein
MDLGAIPRASRKADSDDALATLVEGKRAAMSAAKSLIFPLRPKKEKLSKIASASIEH